MTLAMHPSAGSVADAPEARVQALLAQMTREEKIGQLQQLPGGAGHVPQELAEAIRQGQVGSVINETDVDTVNALQRLAVEESRLGIPLLIGRDVIHGFQTVFPIPLGQAASWNPALVTHGARVAAMEAAACGVNWTFAPMIDIARDPRWGRIAESFGEDPHLASVLGAAMVRGFQGDDLTQPGALAACAKHFAGYGASESGRDYNTTNIPEIELRNVYLPPFEAAVRAGVASLMTSFSDLNGVPATANAFLLRQVLRQEWGFDGLVVSDWESVAELAVHGITANDRESALAAATAGVDMEMVSRTFATHLADLIAEGLVSPATLDAMVTHVLRLKVRLGLFERPYTDPTLFPTAAHPAHAEAARVAAQESLVLLTNAPQANGRPILPLDPATLRSVALIGPLADDPYEQLGTWIFDGDPTRSITVREALAERLGAHGAVQMVAGLETTRSEDRSGFAAAVAAAAAADVALVVLGEESILSGEAHSRADIGLPGAQRALLEAVAATGTPVVLVVMAGRPLALEQELPHAQAVLYAWHPGSMAGPAIVDVLCGDVAPSGKLPVTFPRVTGQIPIYYAHKRTGRPATPSTFTRLHDIPPRAPQTSLGCTSFHLDAGYTPLFPFGHGLSYTTFVYEGLQPSAPTFTRGETLTLRVEVANTGTVAAHEVVQCYVQDCVASVTRPVRELKAFTKIFLAPGARQTVTFTLTADDLAFVGQDLQRRSEAGQFRAWVGGSSDATLATTFTLCD